MNFSARRKIIFDMDGVITGEDCYWDAAALTVWELLFSEKYLGIKPALEVPAFKTNLSTREIAAVRQVIFCKDKVISFFKQRAVNSNWDLAFLTFAFQFIALIQQLASRRVSFAEGNKGEEIIGTKGVTAEKLPLIRPFISAAVRDWEPSFEAVLGDWPEEAQGGELMKKLRKLLPLRYTQIFGDDSTSASPLWKDTQEIFQEWYFGEQKFKELFGKEPVTFGKKGLFYREKPIIEIAKVKATLSELGRLEWELGIATGRPLNELFHPLEQMGIWSYFQKDSVVTYDEVAIAEKTLKEDFPGISLGKPHPYSFLKAYWGKEKSDRQLAVSPPLPQQGMCWVVGDAMADLLAARNAGVHFIGVLTGHNGISNKEIFIREGADVVLPDITWLPSFFAKNI